MTGPILEPLSMYRAYPPEEMTARAQTFYEDIKRRRTVREFSDKPVPLETIEYALLAAGTEVEERDFYNGRAPQHAASRLTG